MPNRYKFYPHPQPLMYPFLPKKFGYDFSDPDVRTPWFKEVVKHFIRAENDDYHWPEDSHYSSYHWPEDSHYSSTMPTVTTTYYWEGNGERQYALSTRKPNLKATLYSDLAIIASLG